MTAKFVTKIDGSAMVSDLISNCGILSYFSKICNKSVEKVPKEIALNTSSCFILELAHSVLSKIKNNHLNLKQKRRK